jgi:uncharacterized protein YbjT (DUF2867 family)
MSHNRAARRLLSMDEYAVLGGTGTVGRPIVEDLRAAGAGVRVLSRHAPEHPVDLTTGAGLEAALRGCRVLIDASNGSSRHPQPVLVDGARRVAEAAPRAGIERIVLVSIVGIDRVPYGYYKAKLAQETIVQEGAVPTTIARSTQFHELVAGLFEFLSRARLILRSAARLQPIAAADAARVVAEIARDVQPPAMINVAGPEVMELTQLAAIWRERIERRLVPVPAPLPPRLGTLLRTGALTTAVPDVRGQTSFRSWLATRI